MANEITITTGLQVAKGALSVLKSTSTFRANMAGSHYAAGTQAIGFAAHEILNLPAEVATAGWCWLKNHDATNLVTIGTDSVGNGSGTFRPLLEILPGEEQVVRMATKEMFLKASVAACIVEFRVAEK